MIKGIKINEFNVFIKYLFEEIELFLIFLIFVFLVYFVLCNIFYLG